MQATRPMTAGSAAAPADSPHPALAGEDAGAGAPAPAPFADDFACASALLQDSDSIDRPAENHDHREQDAGPHGNGEHDRRGRGSRLHDSRAQSAAEASAAVATATAGDRPPLVASGDESERLFAPRYRDLSLGAIALVALGAFEALAVTTAMPTIAQALDGLALYALAFAGSLASSVVGMVAAGSWADARGPAAPLRHGIVWFVLGLILAGLAQSMPLLIAGRVLQGFGAGLMSVALYVVVGRCYPVALRVKVFASFAAAWVVPALVGPAISGAIVEHVGWRWVFLSVPAIAVIAAWRVLPALREVGPATDSGTIQGAGEQRTRLLWAVLATASLLGLHYGGQQPGWRALAWLLPATVALGAATSRLLPRGALRAARGLPTVVSLRGIAAGGFFLAEAYIPLLLSQQRGLSPTWAGLVLTLGAIGWSTGSWLRSRVTDPRAPPRLLQTGMTLLALGVVAIATLIWPSTPIALGIAGWIVAGLGMGCIYPTLSVLMLELSPPEQQGLNSSALHLGDAIYTATALAIGGSVFAALMSRSHLLAYACGFAIAFAMAALGLLLAARVVPPRT